MGGTCLDICTGGINPTPQNKYKYRKAIKSIYHHIIKISYHHMVMFLHYPTPPVWGTPCFWNIVRIFGARASSHFVNICFVYRLFGGTCFVDTGFWGAPRNLHNPEGGQSGTYIHTCIHTYINMYILAFYVLRMLPVCNRYHITCQHVRHGPIGANSQTVKG